MNKWTVIQLDALAVMVTRNCLFLHLISVMAIAYHVLLIKGTKELGKGRYYWAFISNAYL